MLLHESDITYNNLSLLAPNAVIYSMLHYSEGGDKNGKECGHSCDHPAYSIGIPVIWN